jgi:hypothetical protein
MQTGFDYRSDLDAVAAGFEHGDRIYATFCAAAFDWKQPEGICARAAEAANAATRSAPCSASGADRQYFVLSDSKSDVLALAVSNDPNVAVRQ